MPKLNTKNEEVRKYITNVAKYWIRECGIDGWRLDVGDEISHSFWKYFRKEIKGDYPDALIIGEVWHYADDFLMGDEWDTVMNYDFLHAIKDYLVHRRIGVSGFHEAIGQVKGRIHSKVFPVLLNLFDSHDTERFYHAVGYDKKRFMIGVALQLLSPGMPMIYYGDEYGMKGSSDPDCRRGMYWKAPYQDLEVYAWYKRLIEIRKEYPVILEDPDSYSADDATGILKLHFTEYTLVFNTGAGPVEMEECKDRRNLIFGETLSGILAPYSVVLFK